MVYFLALIDEKISWDSKYGFITQDVEKVIPELVTEDNDGYKFLKCSSFVAVLLEAVKEQQDQIEALSGRLEKLEESGKIKP